MAVVNKMRKDRHVCYFVAFCQHFIYEYMDMDGWTALWYALTLQTQAQAAVHGVYSVGYCNFAAPESREMPI